MSRNNYKHRAIDSRVDTAAGRVNPKYCAGKIVKINGSNQSAKTKQRLATEASIKNRQHRLVCHQ